MKTMVQFVNRNRIRIENQFADSNPNNPEWRDANHWKVILRMGKKQLTTYFSMGYGLNGEPKAADVLDSLASDASGVENARSFEEWAMDYGYDPDSRKAERLFKICERQAKRLRDFLGDEKYNELLWEVEK